MLKVFRAILAWKDGDARTFVLWKSVHLDPEVTITFFNSINASLIREFSKRVLLLNAIDFLLNAIEVRSVKCC